MAAAGTINQDMLDKIVAGTMERMVEDMTEKIVKAMQNGEGACESPIELMFYCAWSACQRTLYGNARIGGKHLAYFGEPNQHESVVKNALQPSVAKIWLEMVDGHGCVEFLIPQMSVGEYRVDFVWMRHELDEDGSIRAGAITVECDGKDFHDAEVSQLRRDRRRDRQLQAAGYPVVRFTGAELYRNPVECVRQADEVLESSMKSIGGAA